MKQGELFDDRPSWQREAKEKKRDSAQDLHRVARDLQRHILDFCRDHVGLEFHMADLVDYVSSRHHAAPSSTDRVLRKMRSDGLVKYTVVNRSKSLYRIDGVTG